MVILLKFHVKFYTAVESAIFKDLTYFSTLTFVQMKNWKGVLMLSAPTWQSHNVCSSFVLLGSASWPPKENNVIKFGRHSPIKHDC